MTKADHALVIGASSGIGRAVAHEVAPLVSKLTLASRSCPPDLLSSIKTRNPSVDVTHVKLDVSNLHDVRKFTNAHKKAAFDWIVMSPGILSLSGRTETPEGLDVKMATHYYGRYSFAVHGAHNLILKANAYCCA
jgi:NAD(P)-dependent dehydrogenase (short-subunit alcohol dehydrogenase family)